MTEPRLRFRTSTDTDGEVQRVLGKLEESNRALPIVRLVANWESGFRPFVLMADALLVKGKLDPVAREIVVLYISVFLGLEYEWEEHEPIARRAGVNGEQIAALEGGGLPEGHPFTESQLMALAVVHELLVNREVSPTTWDSACDLLGESVAVELVFAVAWWGGFVPVAVRALFPLASSHRD